MNCVRFIFFIVLIIPHIQGTPTNMDELKINMNIIERWAMPKDRKIDYNSDYQDSVDPAQFSGVWTVKFKGGIKTDVIITYLGIIYLHGRKFTLRQSNNKKDFPSSKGWMMANGKTGIRLSNNNKMVIQSFCKANCDLYLKNLNDYCCNGTAERKGRTDGCQDCAKGKVSPTRFAGVWSLQFSGGIKHDTTITKDGEFAVLGRKFMLRQSTDKINFPSSEGWMMATDKTGVSLVDENNMKIQSFCAENCQEYITHLKNYCCNATGVRIGGVPTDYQDCPEGDCSHCFPGTSMVMLDEGKKRYMEELRIGDKIMTVENGHLKPTTVLGFLDKKVNQTAYYINLILKDNRSLFISSRHVMFIKGDNNVIQSILAKDVSLGNMVIVNDGEKVGFAPIRNITVALKMGAYVPLTHAGTLLVDGVLVSSYTNADHWLAHIALSPLRWWPTLLLDTERSQNLEGLRMFPRMMRNLGSILGLITMADEKMETIENPVLGMSQLAMETLDKTEF